MGYSLLGSSVHGIFQAEVLEYVAISSSRWFSWPRIEPVFSTSPALAGRFFATDPLGKPGLAYSLYKPWYVKIIYKEVLEVNNQGKNLFMRYTVRAFQDTIVN